MAALMSCLPTTSAPKKTPVCASASKAGLTISDSFIPSVSYADEQRVVSRAELQLPENAFVMGAFGNTYKITPEMFATWMRLMRRMPDAVLWLIDDNEASTASLRAQAVAQGVEASRLVFTPRTSHPEVCARLKLADVYLDTYPYNCGSTTNDVIHAGVPLVTLYGKTLVSRMGLSVMTAVDAASNATHSHAEYEDKVVELSLKKKAGCLPKVVPHAQAMRVGEALAQLRDQVPVLDQPQAHPLPVATDVRLFQICYTDDMRQQTPPGFTALSSLAAGRPDWREFGPIRDHLMHHVLEDDVFYGFFAPHMSGQMLDAEKIRDFVQQHGQDHDVLIFSPFWDLNSLFVNSFVQGDFFHPGLLDCSQAFARSAGLDLRLAELVMHGDNTAFCNSFVAKKRFWLHWLELGEKLYRSAEQGEGALTQSLNQNTVYSHDPLPQKIFVQERLVNMLLAGPEFKSKAWNLFGLPSSANALKLAHAQSGDPLYLAEFLRLRDQVWKDSGIEALAQARDRAAGHRG